MSAFRGCEPSAASAYMGAVLALLAQIFLLSAAWAETPCPVPDGLALKNIALPAARRAVMDHRLVILTFGGALTAGAFAGDPGVTYPARLEANLRAALPGVDVTVRNEAKPGATAADVAPVLPELLKQTGANLLIWGPGGRDVALRLNQTEFQRAVDDGIAAARFAHADLILLDMTYIPAPTRMALVAPYRDRLRRSADDNHVPFLLRHDLMRFWVEDKTLNMSARTDEERTQVARRLFSCMAQSLAAPIAAAVR